MEIIHRVKRRKIKAASAGILSHPLVARFLNHDFTTSSSAVSNHRVLNHDFQDQPDKLGSPSTPVKHTLAMCALVADENRFLREANLLLLFLKPSFDRAMSCLLILRISFSFPCSRMDTVSPLARCRAILSLRQRRGSRSSRSRRRRSSNRSPKERSDGILC